MKEKNYTIQFEFEGKTHLFQIHSYLDFSKGKDSDAIFMADQIGIYMESIGMPSNTAVENARLFGEGGEPIVKVEDTSKF